MRSWKPLLAGIIVIVLLAVGLSMVTVSVPGAQEPVSIEVPVGKVGDRLVYETYDDDGQLLYQRTYAVKELTELVDHDLQKVNGLHVEVGHRSSVDSDWRSHVETIRTSDRMGFIFESETEWEMFSDREFRVKSSLFHESGPSLPGVDFQGKALSYGEELEFVPSSYPSSLSRGSSSSYGAGGVDPVVWYNHGRVFTYAETNLDFVPPEVRVGAVTQAGQLDDVPVLGIVATYESQHSEGTSIETTTWFSAESPYPVLVEFNRTYQQGQRILQTVLSEYQPGHTEIPWGDELTPLELEKAKRDGLAPAEGSGSRLSYPLSEALVHVEDSPQDLEWVLWRQGNPDAELISATMTHGVLSESQEGSMQWRLIFKGPDDAHGVRVEHHPDWVMPIVESLGEITGLPDSVVEEGPVFAISGLVDLWESTRGEAPEFFQWGFEPPIQRGSKYCGYIGSSGNPDRVHEEGLDRVRIGQASTGPCFSDNPEFRYDVLVIDLKESRLVQGSQLVQEITQGGWNLGPSDTGERPRVEPQSGQIEPSSDERVVVGPPVFERSAAIAAPLLVVLLTAYFFPALQFAAAKGLVMVPLFSRIKKSEILDHELRERLHSMVQENPGISPSKLKRETGVGWGTIVHHLAVMEREGLLASKVQGRHRRFFIAADVPPAERAPLGVLANDRAQELYANVIDEPGLATSEIAQRLGVTPAGALKHLKALEETGLVLRKRDGRYVRYYPAQGFRPYDPREAVEVV